MAHRGGFTLSNGQRASNRPPSDPLRDLTDDEKAELQQHCIFCKGETYVLEPKTGSAMNIYCWWCYAGFNVRHLRLPWQLMRGPFVMSSARDVYLGFMELKGTVQPPEIRQIIREFSDTIE